MEFKELKNKKSGELHKILAETREKLRDLHFKAASKQLKNIREVRNARKLVAMVLTLLNKSKEETAGGSAETAVKPD